MVTYLTRAPALAPSGSAQRARRCKNAPGVFVTWTRGMSKLNFSGT